jgi:quinol monooxygenase YgiN
MVSDTIRVVARLAAHPVEEWSGQPAIDAHFASEHIRYSLIG